jgi:hypothetical protein
LSNFETIHSSNLSNTRFLSPLTKLSRVQAPSTRIGDPNEKVSRNSLNPASLLIPKIKGKNTNFQIHPPPALKDKLKAVKPPLPLNDRFKVTSNQRILKNNPLSDENNTTAFEDDRRSRNDIEQIANNSMILFQSKDISDYTSHTPNLVGSTRFRKTLGTFTNLGKSSAQGVAN